MSKHITERQRESWRANLRKAMLPEIMAKRVAATRKSQTALVNAKGEFNKAAKRFRLVSPNNVGYEFINLVQFIRTHPELFLPEDVQERPRSGDHPDSCRTFTRATFGLRSLFRKKSNTSWKGWRAPTDSESINYVQAISEAARREKVNGQR